jgi:hypothetical protein
MWGYFFTRHQVCKLPSPPLDDNHRHQLESEQILFCLYKQYSLIYNIDVPRQAPQKLIIRIITNKVRHLLWFHISLQVCPLLIKQVWHLQRFWIFHCIIITTSNEHYSYSFQRRRRKRRIRTSNSIRVGYKSNKLSSFYIYGQNPNKPPIWPIARIPPSPTSIHNNETSTKGSHCN